jgi:hypothetical protein
VPVPVRNRLDLPELDMSNVSGGYSSAGRVNPDNWPETDCREAGLGVGTGGRDGER